MAGIIIPVTGVPKYASAAALPGSSQKGDLAVTIDTDTLYISDGVSWTAIASPSGSGVTTLAAVGSAPNANAGVISGPTLTLEPADGTHPGVLTAGAQTIGGAKTFSSTIIGDISGNAANVSGIVSETHGGTNQSSYAKGDLIYASATNAISKLGIGTTGQTIRVASTGVPIWDDFYNLSTMAVVQDDFLNGAAGTLVASVGGTGISRIKSAGSTSTNPGTWSLQTGAGTTGWAYLCGSDLDQIFNSFGAGAVSFVTVVRVTALSTGAQTYKTIFGMTDNAPTGSAVPTNGVFWSYTDSVNSGNWTFNCTAASSTTSIDSGIPASTSFVRLGFLSNAAGTSIQGYINGAAVGSPITTNIPTLNLMHAWGIIKSAGTTGVIAYVDAYKTIINLTTSR